MQQDPAGMAQGGLASVKSLTRCLSPAATGGDFLCKSCLLKFLASFPMILFIVVDL